MRMIHANASPFGRPLIETMAASAIKRDKLGNITNDEVIAHSYIDEKTGKTVYFVSLDAVADAAMVKAKKTHASIRTSALDCNSYSKQGKRREHVPCNSETGIALSRARRFLRKLECLVTRLSNPAERFDALGNRRIGLGVWRLSAE